MTLNEVLAVRRRTATLAIASQHAFGRTEPLHIAKLESAVHRQSTGSGGVYKYDTVGSVGATLFYGIAMSHSFENGNKRTALVALLVFLDNNRVLLVGTGEDELYELARSVAAHEIVLSSDATRSADSEVHAVTQWIEARTRLRTLGDSLIDFKDLRRLLEEQGCEFERPEGNYIKIKRGDRSYRTGFPRANFQMQVVEVKRIRRALKLDEVHGIDSAGFYSLDAKVDHYVNGYRNLMKRLADL